MTLPTIDGLHYVGCHCNDVCACFDPIECIHEQCICDRLSAAYRRGREDAVQSVGMALIGRYGDPVNSALHEAVSAAARGDGEQA